VGSVSSVSAEPAEGSDLLQLENRYTRPDWVRRLNAMGDAVGGAHRLVSLEIDPLVAAARDATGLEDFGDLDGDWRRRLETLVEEVERSAHLHVVGRLMTRQEILRCLESRLLLTAARRATPAIARESIERPIVIAGPARSGTSILQELLDLDPLARSPLAYEALHPAPLPGLEGDRRRAASECEQELWADVQSEFTAIHELAAHLPMECIALQQPSFGGYYWPMALDVPGFAPDFPAAMAWHRAVLQHLQHTVPSDAPARTWVLKTPVYLMMLDLLFATYPDAQVLVTHRDPVKTMPSAFSTLATVRWLRSDRVELDDLTRSGSALLLLALLERKRSGTLPGRVVDVLFADLMRDPAGTVEATYDAIGRPFSPGHADAIRDYVARKPKGKFGPHRYTPEEWGFDPTRIREQTRPYMEAYGIPEED
jgi:hypothetical protein